MTDTLRPFRLGPSFDGPGSLAEFLKGASGLDVVIEVEPERPFTAPELQLLLAADADPAGPSSLRVAPASPRILSGLRLLGLEDRVEVAA